MAAETYPGWSVLVWKLFLELHFFGGTNLVSQKQCGNEGAREQHLGRNHVSAQAECQPPRFGEAWRSSRIIVGRQRIRLAVGQTSGWLVVSPRAGLLLIKTVVRSLTGEIPTRPDNRPTKPNIR